MANRFKKYVIQAYNKITNDYGPVIEPVNDNTDASFTVLKSGIAFKFIDSGLIRYAIEEFNTYN